MSQTYMVDLTIFYDTGGMKAKSSTRLSVPLRVDVSPRAEATSISGAGTSSNYQNAPKCR